MPKQEKNEQRKEINKEAAKRYRQKKKILWMTLENNIDQLVEEVDKLRKKVDELKQEIKIEQRDNFILKQDKKCNEYNEAVKTWHWFWNVIKDDETSQPDSNNLSLNP